MSNFIIVIVKGQSTTQLVNVDNIVRAYSVNEVAKLELVNNTVLTLDEPYIRLCQKLLENKHYEK